MPKLILLCYKHLQQPYELHRPDHSKRAYALQVLHVARTMNGLLTHICTYSLHILCRPRVQPWAMYNSLVSQLACSAPRTPMSTTTTRFSGSVPVEMLSPDRSLPLSMLAPGESNRQFHSMLHLRPAVRGGGVKPSSRWCPTQHDRQPELSYERWSISCFINLRPSFVQHSDENVTFEFSLLEIPTRVYNQCEPALFNQSHD